MRPCFSACLNSVSLAVHLPSVNAGIIIFGPVKTFLSVFESSLLLVEFIVLEARVREYYKKRE